MPSFRSRARVALAVLFALVTAAGCGADRATSPAPGAASLTVVAAPVTSDTVHAAPAQAIVLQVRGTDGRPAHSGVMVYLGVTVGDTGRRFERGLVFCSPSAPVCETPDARTGIVTSGTFARADTTDASGYVRMQVRFGTVPGRAYALVSVPQYALRDSIAFTVGAGQVARVRVRARDTVVTIGARVDEVAAVSDQFGNARPEVASFAASGTVPFDVDVSGAVTTRETGRGDVIARYGSVADTVHVSVVPRGRISVYSTTGFFGLLTVNLDGTNAKHTTTATGSFSMFPDAAPGGGAMLFTDSDSTHTRAAVYVVDSSGANRRRLFPIGALNPRYSADGSAIFYGINDSTASLWRAHADGGDPVRVYRGSSEAYAYPYFVVSPDGLRVYDPYPGRVVTIATGASLPLAIPTADGARWSPDGRSIYYFSGGASAISISAIDADGTNRRDVSPVGRHYSYFDVSPDGAWLIARSEEAGTMELIRIADRSYITLKLGPNLYQPSWR